MMPALSADSTRRYRHEPRSTSSVWAGVALIACLLIGGWSLFSALKPVGAQSTEGSRISLEQSTQPETAQHALASGAMDSDRPQRAVVAAANTITLRALVPERALLGRAEVLFVDVWDGLGYPSAAAVRAVLVAPNGQRQSIKLAATQMAGRKRFDVTFQEIGQYQLHIDVADLGAELSVAIEVDPVDRT